MNWWKVSNFFRVCSHLRYGLCYSCSRYQTTLKEVLPLKTAKSKYLMPSLLSAILFVKTLNENKSANEKIIAEADILYEKTEYEKLFSFLNLHRATSNPEILWRIARANFEKARNIKDDKEKLFYLEEALTFIDTALEIKEDCWAAHKWRAILLDYVWRYKSTKERIIHSFEVKKHMERAIELNPTDGTNYYILGEWCYTFADMPWYQRKIAAAIFASPPTSTFEEALECFETAEKVNPQFYSMNLLMIGKCNLKLNNKEKAHTYLNMAVNYPIKTPDDKKAHEEAEKLLQNM